MSHFEPGLIFEFVDTPLSLSFLSDTKEVYTVRFGPSTVGNIMNIHWNNQRYGATPQHAKKHLLTVLAIGEHSESMKGTTLRIVVPFYPPFCIPVSEFSKHKEMVLTMIDTYF